eukprot:COSAG02_NODE_1203_length_13900_cov_11.040287_15_plen_114_part_00
MCVHDNFCTHSSSYRDLSVVQACVPACVCCCWSPEQAGCGRVMEGQLRFDSARYGAALDIVFTGSVEHLRDQEWQNDSCAQPSQTKPLLSVLAARAELLLGKAQRFFTHCRRN